MTSLRPAVFERNAGLVDRTFDGEPADRMSGEWIGELKLQTCISAARNC